MDTATQRRLAVVDVETTGLSPWRHDRIVEIAMVLCEPDGEICDEYETLINPERDIGPTRIHGIKSADVLKAPTFSELAGDIVHFLKNAQVLAGHNISFDRMFLIKEFDRIGYSVPQMPLVCTCRLLGRTTLEACCKEFGVMIDGPFHSALSDARATAKLLKLILSDDPSLVSMEPFPSNQWPSIPKGNTPCITRERVRARALNHEGLLHRIASKIAHDSEAESADLLSYLSLIDRILEDRLIDEDEEQLLLDAVNAWGISQAQIAEAHRTYIQNLAVHALADNVITPAERSDIKEVARLLGYEEHRLDEILEKAARQLQNTSSKGKRSSELEGKRVCFTGELFSKVDGQPITRALAQRLAEQAGMITANSVSKKLDLLVVADPNTQSGKARKARDYGIRIMAESVFWSQLGIPVS